MLLRLIITKKLYLSVSYGIIPTSHRAIEHSLTANETAYICG